MVKLGIQDIKEMTKKLGIEPKLGLKDFEKIRAEEEHKKATKAKRRNELIKFILKIFLAILVIGLILWGFVKTGILTKNSAPYFLLVVVAVIVGFFIMSYLKNRKTGGSWATTPKLPDWAFKKIRKKKLKADKTYYVKGKHNVYKLVTFHGANGRIATKSYVKKWQ